MSINVKCDNPNLKVSVNQSPDGNVTVIILENNASKLGSCEPGSVVKIGNREHIVLGHADETTAVITKEFAKQMEFGKSGDYEKSDVRSYCNGEFYKELAKSVGKENIIQHTVKLEADDGTGKGKTCKDFVSIITTENYRRYREFLKPYGDWWWTATRVNYDDSDYARRVCYVNPSGVLSWIDSGCCRGVHPFCVLRSSIEVEAV